MDTGETEPTQPLAVPPRPARRLSLRQLATVGLSNSVAACDEELFDDLIVQRRYLLQPVFVISDPDGIKRVMLDNIGNYPRLPQVTSMFRRGLGIGLFSSEGEFWRGQRRLVNPTLDNRSVMGDLPLTIDCTEDLARQLSAAKPNASINIGDRMERLLLKMNRHTFAGPDADPAVEETINRVSHYHGKFRVSDLFPLPAWLDFLDRGRSTSRAAFPVFDRLIAERRAAGYAGAQDLIWRLVESRDRRTGARLDDAEVHGEILALANAAILTTLRALTWFWYVLALHPSAEARLHAELDQVLGGRPPTPADFSKLVFLDRVLSETMRLYPPVPIMLRSASAEDVICGRRIPRGAVIAIVPWIVHRHRKLWRDPDRFDPDRFSPEQNAARSRFCYLPFSTGPRVCVGQSLAEMQLRVIIAILAQRFRLRLVPGHPVEATGTITLRPRYGLRVTVEPRRPASPA